MHIEGVKATVSGFGLRIVDNSAVKFVIGGMTGLGTTFLNNIGLINKDLIFIVIMIYLIDLLCGVGRAIKLKQFSSKQFFKGVFKLLVYFIILFIGVSLDIVLHTGSVITGIIFAYIIITDSTSILENLNLMGYKTPTFLIKYLKIQSERLEKKLLENEIDLEKELNKDRNRKNITNQKNDGIESLK